MDRRGFIKVSFCGLGFVATPALARGLSGEPEAEWPSSVAELKEWLDRKFGSESSAGSEDFDHILYELWLEDGTESDLCRAMWQGMSVKRGRGIFWRRVPRYEVKPLVCGPEVLYGQLWMRCSLGPV